MKKRILKTLESYLLTNMDVLNEEQIIDIKEQIKTVRESLYSKDIYPIYQENHDITFVMVEILDEDGEPVSLECIGWHFGEPDTDIWNYKKDFSEDPKDKEKQLKATFWED